ncbi:interferon-induced very large GTPase 1 isoform X2 [Eucyclogobius newberryi]|uniref:interferon-induced very large GTPase 1 isoform X2 n=1 Tax=Eucyclogobius newberryi TaxID=166745 RepID=UPI003B5CC6CE
MVSFAVEPPSSSQTFDLVINYCAAEQRGTRVLTDTPSVDIKGLCPGIEYMFTITRRIQSSQTYVRVVTAPIPPLLLSVSDIRTDSVTLSWEPPAGEVQNYTVTCCRGEEVIQELQTDESSVTIGALRPGQQYLFSVCAQLQNGHKNEPAVTSAGTKTHVECVLENLGLEKHYNEKLCLNKMLQIDEKTMIENNVMSNKDVAWYVLKKLMMVNVTARSVKCSQVSDSNCSENFDNAILDLQNLVTSFTSACTMNPLDIITGLFLCSDGFVQQELSLKMSMCQFAVPLLLPNCDTNQCTLMLWALRDIVKKYRPKFLSESKGFREECIVHSEIPMISFVRIGECSLSKSEILNKLLSNSQQYHDIFVHHNMQSGDCPRTISNGLAEITWYLPCGNKNIDIFDEPVAVANLRGDISSFETQFSFLCQTSSAVFVFFDSLEYKCKQLVALKGKAEIFLIGNHQGGKICLKALHKVATELGLTNSNIIMKTNQMNDADFVDKLQKTIRGAIESSKMRMPIEQMASTAHELGVHVDEDSPECQKAKKNADAITAEINDMLKFKETQLPMQGQMWNEVTSLEKEGCKLRKAGSENIDEYRFNLDEQIRDLRKKQNSFGISDSMSCFLIGISSPLSERCFFLKWLRINLDNISREKLSWLRELYKEKSKASNSNEIKEIDRQLSNSSLGTEHFFREMGQIYEASVSLPENDPSRQQLQHLPRLCAQLLLDGFPLELVDGDASNIPLKWVSDVLTQLNELVSPNNKIRVITVLGVQSTGKSTLLNTMFGVQFAVSSGRCTRGAFMLLIRISEDIKATLKCDFLVIIDTEGLKSPELAQLDDSHEHDNELATLVVGLSDITIINIAMENSTEMRDILQIVVHAFLRMKEVGKKPKCQFVHQNVSDVSAHDKNLRDRKLLLQQLNEMTQAAAKMESKEENKSFIDVMDYDPNTGNWYIPGLWNGNPPMAPVNAGYSEAVYELKKKVMHNLEKCESSVNDIVEFREWITSLWKAVKHENFIFSFRNSLVADAYMRLCTEYNKWEWEFRKDMYSWVTNAETKICNIGIVAEKPDIGEVLTCLKREAQTELCKWETALLHNLTDYFRQTEGHVYLVERYREEFFNGAKILRREIESSVINQLTATAEIKQAMEKVDKIKDNHTKDLEERVCALIEKCRKEKRTMTDQELDEEFNKIWKTTVTNLDKSVSYAKCKNVFAQVGHELRANILHKGSHASELVNQKKLEDCGLDNFVVKPEGMLKKIKNTAAKLLHFEDGIMAAQKMADSTITACQQFILEKLQRETDYHDTYIQEILKIIDEKLLCNQQLKTDIVFEVSLKQHICGDASRRFQKMHEDFMHKNDPYTCLSKNKQKFCTDFKDVFNEKDQCQKKANEFTNLCLRPAVETFLTRSLGPDIVSEMLTCHQFNTRTVFQYYVLLNLISNENFDKYLNYIDNYENFIKEWIFQQIVVHFSDTCKISEIENKQLQLCMKNITSAINQATKTNGNLKEFIDDFCKDLIDKLVISQDALGAFMILNNANQEQFAYWLTKCVKEMIQSLQNKYKKTPFAIKLNSLSLKPHHELSDKMIVCGQQCPFCKAPCEAGGKGHTEHWTSLHQSQGLGRFRDNNSVKLICDICSTLVQSEANFRCLATFFKWHPYKQYAKIFPNWKISPDVSLEASDYWKYVMVKFNKDFANAYNAKPAEIPKPWKSIGQKQAIESLKAAFYIH